MVVLEGGGSNVVTIGNNQYLQPDYLSPLPTTLDAKKSPLALLAQTCSQIGADSPGVKPLVNTDKKRNDNSSKSPSVVKTPKSASTPEIKLAFKPYETNVLSQTHTISTGKSDELNQNFQQQQQLQQQYQNQNQPRPSSKSSTSASSECSANYDDNKSKSKTLSADARIMNTASPEINVSNSEPGKNSPNSDQRKPVSPSVSQRGASPIIRSGLEVLQGHPKDLPLGSYKGPVYGLNALSALCCPPGMEQHTNPAFRPPYAGGYPTANHHAAMLAVAAANGYSAAQSNTTNNPYISYQRIKTPSGVEAIVPVCKDPYCTGCPYSAHTQQMLLGAPCPSGCTQCEHQKYGLAMAASMGSFPTGHPYAAAAAAAAAAQAQLRSPYVCSWTNGDSYCGKRFNTSDELFTHLRTHTGNLSDPAAAAAALAQSQTQSLLSSLFPQSALQRAYASPALSPLSASRYHPYGKPGGIPTSMPGSPYTFNPAAAAAAAAALGPYYSPYAAMYGQRIGSATVHP